MGLLPFTHSRFSEHSPLMTSENSHEIVLVWRLGMA
jgi:hypothetical protein